MKSRSRWILSCLLVAALAGIAGFWLRPVAYFNTYSEARLLVGGARTHTITVDGYSIHYYVAGPVAGRPVVLVHGLGGRSENWTNLAPYLTKAGYRVYLPDLPGFGQSQKPAGFSYSVRDQAQILARFLDGLSLSKVDIGGWSMGGWIVQLFAVDNPERVHKLLLFDSAGISLRPDWNTGLFTPSTGAELAQLDALLMPYPPAVPDFVAQDILRISSQDAWIIHRAMASMLTGRDATDLLLPQLRMPVLIVWGQSDRITPLTEGEKIHQLIPGSELELIPNCGHLAPSMCASQIGPGLVRFLR